MSDYPRATPVLLDAMHVVGEDQKLPLDILINLHRRQLRAPLERLAHLSDVPRPEIWTEAALDERPQVIMKWLAAQWPTLNNGERFRNNTELFTLGSNVHGSLRALSDDELFLLAGSPDPATNRLIFHSVDEWTSYDPLYIIHRLSWAGAATDWLLQILDIQLSLDPAYVELVNEFIV